MQPHSTNITVAKEMALCDSGQLAVNRSLLNIVLDVVLRHVYAAIERAPGHPSYGYF